MYARDSDLVDVITRNGCCVPHLRKPIFQDSKEGIAIHAHGGDECPVTTTVKEHLPRCSDARILHELRAREVNLMSVLPIDSSLFAMLETKGNDSSDSERFLPLFLIVVVIIEEYGVHVK